MRPTVADLLSAVGPTVSFEFGPPKNGEAEAERRLWQTIRDLESLNPSFVSVTYGAGGSTRENTIGLVERIAQETTLLPIAHLTAVNQSVADLRRIVDRLAESGITNVLAIRGDPPGDPLGEWVPHPDGVSYAADLVRLLRSRGDFCVGVAAFPFKHPRSPDIDTDTRWFVEKCRAGADYAITQMFFQVDDYLRLRDRVVAAGCDTPILAGIMPITSMRTIERSTDLSGARFPLALAHKFEAVSSSRQAVRELGIAETTALCERLLAEGVPGIHFITFNYSSATREVWGNLNLQSGGVRDG